jgi:hypothetical protein
LRVDLRLHADARPHLRHRLRRAGIVRIAVVGAVQGEAEALREAGLGEQAARQLGIEGGHAELRVVAEHAGRQPLAVRRGGALHHLGRQRLAVDGVRQGAAHPQVLERVLGQGLAGVVGHEGYAAGARIVRVQVDHPQPLDLGDGDAVVAAQARQVGGGDLVDDVDIAGEQRRGAGGVVGDEAVVDLRPFLARAVPGVIAREHGAVAGSVGDEAVGAGADGGAAAVVVLGAGAFAGVARDDGDRRHVGGQQRVRAVGVQPQGERVDDLDPGDGTDEAAEPARAVRHVGGAGQAEGDVVGGEVAAVMPLHPGAQLELPHALRHRGPALGEAGQQPGAGVLLHQPVEDVAGERVVRGGAEEVRIDRGDRPADADVEGLRGRRRRRGGQEQRGAQRQAVRNVHAASPG